MSPNEVRHHRATPAALRFQVSRIWNGHVIRELEGAEPTLFPVHHAGAETVASKFTRVLVDPLGTLQELVLVGKQEVRRG